MRARYLIVAGERSADLTEHRGGILWPTDLPQTFAAPALSVFANEHCGRLTIGERGCIVGRLFRQSGQLGAVASLTVAEASAVIESDGADLLGRFWGGYVAALSSPDSVRVMRDPSAALPCYFVQGQGFVAFASDAETLVDTGLASIELDWRALAAHLYASGVPTPATALAGISELLAGFSLRTPGPIRSQQPCWSPWNHVDRRADDADVGTRLAKSVKRCVSSWASVHGRLLASVSGGLDSSIVAAALAEARADSTCLTIYDEDPSGDERLFARVLCDHLGLQLIERQHEIDRIEITAPLGTHLPRPTDRTHAMAYERAHLETAREIGATAFVTGNGGDSVFGYSQSAAAIADRFLSDGFGRGVVQTLRDVCTQTGCGIFEAGASALRIARGPRAYRCRPDSLFLSHDVISSVDDAVLAHPWLEAPADALPGKAAHIASVLRMQQCLEPSRGRYLPVLNPLMSQPVIETCLGVPSWEWRVGGRDRSLARRAFSADLPPLILQRRVKGGPDGFAARILDHFRNEIRERLLDGNLARERIVDRDAIEGELDNDRPGGGEQRARILEFVAAEAWIDSWLSRRSASGNAQSGGPERIDARSASQCSSSS
jgi:asparagine synthase (glutamine-hydrolysing)